MFAKFHISIFDADNEIKKILTRKEIKQKLKEAWPSVLKSNTIDKHKLRTIIFSNKREKKKLEKILYPCLKTELKKFENKNKKKKILVYDVPLIYETKSENKYDLILLANCDKKTQRNRVLARDKISNSIFENIIVSQLSFNHKKKFKPKIINTNNLKFFIFMKVLLLMIKIFKLKIENGTKKNLVRAETTGLDFGGDRIIEIGIVELRIML